MADAYRFDSFEVRVTQRSILREGKVLPLGARAFDVLITLIRNRDRLVTKGELLDSVWAGMVVEEANVQVQVSLLRKVLGSSAIATIPGFGYRFTACLEGASSTSGSSAFLSDEEPSTPPLAPILRTNLPRHLPALLGRGDDLAALGTMLDQHPLISIVGTGGIGKSLLTQHLLDARRTAYKHGVCWVELATAQDEAGLLAAMAATLGIHVSGSNSLACLCTAMAPLSMLIALDNAEHLIDGVARTVQALLNAAPQVRWVVTSQVSLKLGAECVYRIGALAVPEGPLPATQALAFGSVALFTERARASDSRFRLSDANVPAVIALCGALDGMPLAIELAAARASMLGVHHLASSIQDRLKLLTSSLNRAAPARQLTLRATLDWSHSLLSERERTVFRRLAVFGDSGSLTMIKQVVTDPDEYGGLDEWAVLDALCMLVDRSMAAVLTNDDTAEPRYRLLGSPRAYALERLQEAGEEAELRQRHMRAIAAFCATVERAFTFRVGDSRSDAGLRPTELELDNMREAMTHAVTEGDSISALQIGITLQRGLWGLSLAQCLATIDQGTAMLNDGVPPALRVRWWLGVSVALRATNGRRAEEAARRALEVLQQTPALMDDRLLAYRTWCQIATTAFRFTGDRTRGQAALAEARKLEDPAWPPGHLMYRIDAELMAVTRGSAESLRLAKEKVSLAVSAGTSGYGPRVDLIDDELAAGDARAAAGAAEALLADLQGGRDVHIAAYARMMLLAARLALDEVEQARCIAEVGWIQAPKFSLQAPWATYLALLAALEGRPQAAARLAGYADASYTAREMPSEPNEAAALERARALARSALGDAEMQCMQDEGMVLHDDQIAAIAFGARAR